MSKQRQARRLFAKSPARSSRGRKLGMGRMEQLEQRAMMAVTFGDFNGDGYADTAVGAPGENIGSIADAGAVNVIYGSFLSTVNSGNQIWHQPGAGQVGSGTLQGNAGGGDKFGSALAAGDFDNDGYEDLAIGIPGEDRGPLNDAGAVQILYGSTSGLSHQRNTILHQDSWRIDDFAERFDRFGSVLTTGDFNADGYADLAIGVPEENVGKLSNAGAVHILFGSYAGLHSAASADGQLWHQNISGVEDDAERYDNFGAALAAGDLNGDGADDLVIGVPGEDVGSTIDAGAVSVLFGEAGTGLKSSGDLLFHQDSSAGGQNLNGIAEAFDYFGSSLAVGDFNGDNRDDVAIGVPGEDVGSKVDAGAVHVLHGHATSGVTISGDRDWTQDTANIEGVAEDYDLFGASVAAGDFNGDGRDDLAVGVPGEDVGSINDAGAINIIYSQSGGTLNASGDRLYTQNNVGVEDAAAAVGNAFGSSLATGYSNFGSFADLAVATPGQRVANRDDAGAVYTLFGKSGGGWAETLNQIWHQNSSSILGSSETGDLLGGAKPLGLRSDGLQVPKLESDPTAPRNLYLDFNGNFQANWNGSTKDATTPAFDIDGQRDHFSRTELQLMEDAWDHAAEDFAPFDVNVTTVYPGSMSDGVNLRVAIGGWWHDWFREPSDDPTSGVASLNSFTDSNKPNVAFVFAESIALERADLSTEDVAAKIGTTISHEAGHAFGLEHKSDIDQDGDEVREYSRGGTDWTPIMGGNLSTDRTIWTEESVEITAGSLWAEGDHDVEVLTDRLGERDDDHGDTLSTATSLGTLNQFNSSILEDGIIETKMDIDTFTFQVGVAGPLTIQVLVNDVGANLNSRLGFGPVSLYQYSYLAESNPAGDLNSSITFNVQPGEFYVDVASVREFLGDLGQYTLRIDLGVQPLVALPIVTVGFPILPIEERLASESDKDGSKSRPASGDFADGAHAPQMVQAAPGSTRQPSSRLSPEELAAERNESTQLRSTSAPGDAGDEMRSAATDAVFAAIGRAGFHS